MRMMPSRSIHPIPPGNSFPFARTRLKYASIPASFACWTIGACATDVSVPI